MSTMGVATGSRQQTQQCQSLQNSASDLWRHVMYSVLLLGIIMSGGCTLCFNSVD